jgi:hypothetical protein
MLDLNLQELSRLPPEQQLTVIRPFLHLLSESTDPQARDIGYVVLGVIGARMGRANNYRVREAKQMLGALVLARHKLAVVTRFSDNGIEEEVTDGE